MKHLHRLGGFKEVESHFFLSLALTLEKSASTHSYAHKSHVELLDRLIISFAHGFINSEVCFCS